MRLLGPALCGFCAGVHRRQDARGDKASGVLGGRIFAIGGETSRCVSTSGVPLPSQPVTDVEAFDTDKPKAGWVAVSSIPEHKVRFASAAVGDTIYVFGGQHTWGFTADHTHDHDSDEGLDNDSEEGLDNDSDEGLDSGAIAGIVVACVGVGVALAALVYCHLRGTHQCNAEKHIELCARLIGSSGRLGSSVRGTVHRFKRLSVDVLRTTVPPFGMDVPRYWFG